MTDEASSRQALFESLADPDCRSIVAALDEPMTAREVAEQCDLSQTSSYRKLERLSDADMVEQRTDVRSDGHHTTQFVRDFSGVVVAYDEDDQFDVDVVSEGETPDERLARFWSQISEEL
jgi:DNA-binding transcriptional ArsR family regulator